MNWIEKAEQCFGGMSVRRKLTLMSFGISVVVSLLSSAAFYFFLVAQLEETITEDVEAVAEMTAHNVTVAIAFGDAEVADEVLGALAAKRLVTAAYILTGSEGTDVFSRYGAGDLAAVSKDGISGMDKEGSQWIYTRPILVRGSHAADLVLFIDVATPQSAFVSFFCGMLILVVLVAMALALCASTFFRRYVTSPIMELLSTTRAVAERGDFSIRAKRISDDEVGRLADAFNGMLTQIEFQNRELQEQRIRFELAVGGSMDGIWDWDMVEDLHYWSDRFREIIGAKDVPPSFEFFEQKIHSDDQEDAASHWEQVMSGGKRKCDCEFRIVLDGNIVRWVMWRGQVVRDLNERPIRLSGALTDITERKRSDHENEELARRLAETSRHAGMAEIATGVLHNVGNVLNSINVSATLIMDRIRESSSMRLGKVVSLLKKNQDDLQVFFASGGKGEQLPKYFEELRDASGQEREFIESEVTGLVRNVEHVKEIVSMQQSYAKMSGMNEVLCPRDLLEDAMNLNSNSMSARGIRVEKDYDLKVPLVEVDKHKVLQILVNLLTNAVHAVEDLGERDRRVTLKVCRSGENAVGISVRDNGTGIDRDHLDRIFSHGFTTKKDGHGFGLHSSALAATEMGGQLIVQSEGRRKGAVFTLELPVHEGMGGLEMN